MKMYLLLTSTLKQTYMTATEQIQLSPQKNTKPALQPKKLKQTLCQDLFFVCWSIFSHVSAHKLASGQGLMGLMGVSEPHATPCFCKATASPPQTGKGEHLSCEAESISFIEKPFPIWPE